MTGVLRKTAEAVLWKILPSDRRAPLTDQSQLLPQNLRSDLPSVSHRGNQTVSAWKRDVTAGQDSWNWCSDQKWSDGIFVTGHHRCDELCQQRQQRSMWSCVESVGDGTRFPLFCEALPVFTFLSLSSHREEFNMRPWSSHRDTHLCCRATTTKPSKQTTLYHRQKCEANFWGLCAAASWERDQQQAACWDWRPLEAFSSVFSSKPPLRKTAEKRTMNSSIFLSYKIACLTFCHFFFFAKLHKWRPTWKK